MKKIEAKEQWGEVFTYLKNERSPTTASHMNKT